MNEKTTVFGPYDDGACAAREHRLAMQQAIIWRVYDHTRCVNQVMAIDLAPRLKLEAVLPPET